jgi:uncharacterized protein
VGGIESGERNIALVNICVLADTLDVPPSALPDFDDRKAHRLHDETEAAPGKRIRHPPAFEAFASKVNPRCRHYANDSDSHYYDDSCILVRMEHGQCGFQAARPRQSGPREVEGLCTSSSEQKRTSMNTSTTTRIATESEMDISRRPGNSARSGRSQFLKWLRNIHGWVGLWGAVLGLLFGVTGFLQNHRAVMKIKAGGPAVSSVQVPVAADAFHSPRDLSNWVHDTLKFSRPATRVQREPAKPVTWGDQSVMQPEHWTARFIAPHYLVDADYWKGGTFVTVERRDQGVIGVLEAMHRSQGANVGWILLADSIAGSMILLSLTGVILWTELNRKRTIGASIFIVSLIAMIVLAADSIS